ncbi:MAG TPA: type II toxin-antitoxin system ParD family antitoxin [Blastocatellia bacterium]|nr:type II toxin-antitoxin system ParD family antitoxin [Blastocatellia bacterium]
METQDTMTTLSISVLISQKNYIEQQASLAGFADPSDYLRQLIRADQQRKARQELEEMLIKAIEKGKWIEGTPEYWARKKAELTAKYGHETKAK